MAVDGIREINRHGMRHEAEDEIAMPWRTGALQDKWLQGQCPGGMSPRPCRPPVCREMFARTFHFHLLGRSSNFPREIIAYKYSIICAVSTYRGLSFAVINVVELRLLARSCVS